MLEFSVFIPRKRKTENKLYNYKKFVLLDKQIHNKQGSSENDGRSNVYNRSELKVISNCYYTNCCRTTCGNFT